MIIYDQFGDHTFCRRPPTPLTPPTPPSTSSTSLGSLTGLCLGPGSLCLGFLSFSSSLDVSPFCSWSTSTSSTTRAPENLAHLVWCTLSSRLLADTSSFNFCYLISRKGRFVLMSKSAKKSDRRPLCCTTKMWDRHSGTQWH